MLRKTFYSILSLVIGAVLLIAIWLLMQISSSLPRRDGNIQVLGLKAPVTVRFDSFGIPDIRAASRRDAAFALGFVTAGDRLFQMDLIRRKSRGSLADIFGEIALQNDIRQRHLDLAFTAGRILEALPNSQREALEAYAQGVNTYLEQAANLPPEFLLLGYEPEKWRPEDSMLVVLSMFQLLSWSEPEEHMLSAMHECLPPAVTAFLTPDTDSYTRILIGGPHSARPIQPIPSTELATLRDQGKTLQLSVRIDPEDALPGSNNWAVNSFKSANGKALIANDMHLPVSIPNIWYRATLRYQDLLVSGLNLPGVPSIVAGSNGHVAWGFTNFMADVMDLVAIHLNPKDPDRYETPSGWQAFKISEQIIPVKDAESVKLELRRSIWGPVWSETVLGKTVAIQWTALQPEAVDLTLMDLDQVQSVQEGIALFNRAGSPPQNVVLADDRGNIAWTLMGRIPRRVEGFDGSLIRDWAQEKGPWKGFLKPQELPYLLNPESAYIATANSRNVGSDYPYQFGHNYAHSFRTFRIDEALNEMNQVSEQDMLHLQLDTKTDFYEFYRALALEVLNAAKPAENTLLDEARQEILAWDGFARINSRGIPLLATFRNQLINRVFEPFLKNCAAIDSGFKYAWYEMETPLRQLIRGQLPNTLPDPAFESWDHFLRAALEDSAREIKKQHELSSLKNFTWGKFRRVSVSHPLSRGLPWLAGLLNMPDQLFSGCTFCVRVISQPLSASERFVISPGNTETGIMHMPGGQSGHPFSEHYGDQHPYWANGIASPFRNENAQSTLTLTPSP